MGALSQAQELEKPHDQRQSQAVTGKVSDAPEAEQRTVSEELKQEISRRRKQTE